MVFPWFSHGIHTSLWIPKAHLLQRHLLGGRGDEPAAEPPRGLGPRDEEVVAVAQQTLLPGPAPPGEGWENPHGMWQGGAGNLPETTGFFIPKDQDFWWEHHSNWGI